MIDIIRMTIEDDIGTFIEATLSQYSYDLQESLLLDEESAGRKAERDLGHLRNGGLDSNEHHFFHTREVETGTFVGGAWLALESEIRMAWLHYIQIHPPHRRRGFARRTLELLHEYAVSHDCDQIFLNVYAHNPNAQALYRSLGYRGASAFMRRSLASTGKQRVLETEAAV